MPTVSNLPYAESLDETACVVGEQLGEVVRFPTSLFSVSKWWFGSSAPNQGTGGNGDFYLNLTTGDVYTKSSNSWGSAIGTMRGTDGADGSDGVNGTNGVSPLEIYYSLSGNLALRTGGLKRYIRNSHTIVAVKAFLGTAAVGGPVRFDIAKNGASHTIFASDVEIPEGSTSATFNTFTNANIAADDYLSVNITAIGPTTPGADLSITLLLN